MKRLKYILSAILLLLILCSCSKDNSQQEEVSSAPSKHSSYSENSVKASSSPFVTSRNSDTEKKDSLPYGVERASKNKLRYKTSVLSMSVVFPDQFYIEAGDYKPQYGIYLQNDTGTATLLMEAVNDNTLTYRQLKDYLSEKYPQAEIKTTNKKEVICRMSMTDKNGNEFYNMQKFKTSKGGYHLASLSCRPSDKEKYTSVFADISFG